MTPVNRLLLLLLTLVGCAVQPGNVSSAQPSLITDPQALDAVVDRYIDDELLPVLYVRLEDRDGNVIYEHGAVNDMLLPNQTVDGDTWFRIWSMSKPVTIAVAMDLVEQGLLSLEDPVSRYIPEFDGLQVAVPEDGQSLLDIEDRAAACPVTMQALESEMTVLHLINHEAGFYYNWTGFDCIDGAFREQDIITAANSDELIAKLANLPLVQQPGTEYFYGLNTTVLGLVMERATGKTLDGLVRDHLSDPLSIDDLQYGRPDDVELMPWFSGADDAVRLARPEELDIFGSNVPDYDPGRPLYAGGEGMLATADGYADFLRMLLRRGELNGARLLDEATVAEMTAPHTMIDSDWGHNGYNIWVNSGKLPDGGYGKAGLWIVGGYEGTFGWVDTENEFVGVLMTQIHAGSPEANNKNDVIREAIYDQILDERQQTEYKVYYLGGQSNMDGFGYVNELSNEERAGLDDVMIYRGLSAADGSEKGGVGVWDTLQPGYGLGFKTNGVQNWHSDRFGPELSFGQKIAAINEDQRIAIIKYSRGGTPLYIDGTGYGTWNPDIEGLNQYDFALRAIRESLQQTDIDGDGRPDRLTPAGIVWMQGEADAFDSEAAALVYEDNLTRMMGLFRAALGVDDLPVVIGQITDSGMAEDGTVMDWADEVRSAQERFTAADECAELVTVTNELEYPDDDAWHYKSDGYLRMGYAFADSIAELESNCSAQQ